MTDGAVLALLPAPRLKPYLQICDDEVDRALALYAWSSRMSSALFEVIGHLEVFLRSAIDRELARHYDESRAQIPWFLLPPFTDGPVAARIDETRQRLRGAHKETRDQIVAGLTFGFWSGLLGPRHEELWRAALHRAFPHGNGKRKDVSRMVEQVRKLRNRLAHHDSMTGVDVPFELRTVLELAGLISSDASRWLGEISTAMQVYSDRPEAPLDTVVVAARESWPLYLETHAYVCQAGRYFRPVERMAFYADQCIQRDVPRVLARLDDVEWSESNIQRLERSEDRQDRRLAQVIKAARRRGWTGGRYQVFLLSREGDSRHRQLANALPHSGAGRGSAFTQRQRYVSFHTLETSSSTTDLEVQKSGA